MSDIPVRLSDRELDDLELATGAPKADESCVRCQRFMRMREGSEPTAVCDECAQEIVLDFLPNVLAELRQYRTGTAPTQETES